MMDREREQSPEMSALRGPETAHAGRRTGLPSAVGLLALQRSAGNRTVGRLLAASSRGGVAGRSDGRRWLSRGILGDVWDELWKPITFPDPRAAPSANADFDVWVEWTDLAGTGTFRTNLTAVGPLPPRPQLYIPAGVEGKVKFEIKLSTAVHDRPITQSMAFTWRVKTNEYGDLLKFQKESRELGQPTDRLAPLAVRQRDWLVADADKDTRELKLEVSYSSGSESVESGTEESSSSTWGGEGGIEKGPVKGGGKYESTSGTTTSSKRQTTYEAITSTRSFSVKVIVTGQKPRPPAPKPPPPPKTRTRTWWVLFKSENNTDVDANEEHWLYRWWGSLRPETQSALKNGSNQSLVLKGYASTRGKAKINREISQKRINSVMEVLNAAAGLRGGKSLIKHEPEEHPYGEGMSPHPTDVRADESPEFYEKRVEVSVEDLVSSGTDPEYKAVEQELIGRGEARIKEQEQEDKKKHKQGK